MTYSLIWLPQVLRDAGLTVTECQGWQTRGHGDVGKIAGVICHHTCGPRDGDIRDLNVLINGRPDLEGPLCQLGLGRLGDYYVVAAGKAWHAGRGAWPSPVRDKGVYASGTILDGNSHFIGIEAENVGDHTDPWPDVQIDAYDRGVAAILKHIGAPATMCIGHKEWALPKGRKDDPSFDMNAMRARVAKIMAPTPPAAGEA
jgi:hypothetical protein